MKCLGVGGLVRVHKNTQPLVGITDDVSTSRELLQKQRLQREIKREREGGRGRERERE
jgi:hypothetical protein